MRLGGAAPMSSHLSTPTTRPSNAEGSAKNLLESSLHHPRVGTDGAQNQTSWPTREPGILQPMDTQEKILLNVQSMHGFPLRPEHCSPTKYAHLSHSPAGGGEGESEDELETQQFTTSALSQPAVANVLQRV